MRVVLSVPAAWRETDVRGVPTWVVPAPPMQADVMVHAGSIVAVPDDLAGWKEGRARVELPAGTIARSLGALSIETTDGWPVEVSRWTCTDASGVLLEHRIVACYRFLHHVGVVLVRSREDSALAARTSEIDEIVRSARPDFRDEAVIALSELWQL